MFRAFSEWKAKEFSKSSTVLSRQVRYDQFVHFIPNLSRDLQLLRLVVLIKRPVNGTQIVQRVASLDFVFVFTTSF